MAEITLTDALETNNDDKPPICQLIRETRIEAGLSQQDMAVRLGLSVGGYAAYESYREPSYERRQQIAQALEKPEDFFEPIGITGEELENLATRFERRLDEAIRRLEDRLGPAQED